MPTSRSLYALMCLAVFMIIVGLFVGLAFPSSLPVKIQSIEDDGEIYIHLPALKSLDLRVQYSGDGEVDLEESTFVSGKIVPGKYENDPNKLIIIRKGKPDIELIITKIKFTY